jgi:hypothetical protein
MLPVGYVGLFLGRSGVSLRPSRVGSMLAVIVAVRLILLALGWPWVGAADMTLAGTTATGAVVVVLARRAWVLRTDAATLRQQMADASRGLFLPCTETEPGCLVFTAKGASWRLRFTELGKRFQLLVLPDSPGTGKMGLLVQWVSKQYPGPIPRVRINLKKE